MADSRMQKGIAVLCSILLSCGVSISQTGSRPSGGESHFIAARLASVAARVARAETARSVYGPATTPFPAAKPGVIIADPYSDEEATGRRTPASLPDLAPCIQKRSTVAPSVTRASSAAQLVVSSPVNARTLGVTRQVTASSKSELLYRVQTAEIARTPVLPTTPLRVADIGRSSGIAWSGVKQRSAAPVMSHAPQKVAARRSEPCRTVSPFPDAALSLSCLPSIAATQIGPLRPKLSPVADASARRLIADGSVATAGRASSSASGRPGAKVIRATPSAAAAKQPPSGAATYRFRKVVVQVGMFATILTTGIESVAVADPTVADVVVLSSRSVLVNGKSRGVTNMVMWDAGGFRTFEIRVIDRTVATPDEVQQAIGLPGVGVRLIGDAVILDGEVDSPEQAAQAKAIAGLFADKIIDFLTVGEGEKPEAKKVPPIDARQVEDAIGIPGVQVKVANGAVILRGTVANENQKTHAEQIASLYTQQVISGLEVEKPKPAPPPTLEEIIAMIGSPTVKVREVRDRVLLEGEVASAADKERAATIAAQLGKTVDNRLVTPEDKLAAATSMAKQIQDAIAMPSVQVLSVGDKFVLKGTVPGIKDKQRILETAKLYSTNIDDTQLLVSEQYQVKVEMKLAEVNRSKLKDLGFDSEATLDGSITFGKPIGEKHFSLSEYEGGLSSSLVAEKTLVKGRVLASPSATVLSGKKVSFQVGGEYPVPVITTSANGNTQSVEFKEYGILMDVTPTVTPERNVTLEIRIEKSDVDKSTAVNIGGGLVFGTKKSSAETMVRLKDTETLVIAGLISQDRSKTVTTIPILGDIPVLGGLFSKTTTDNKDKELVIFVTPHVAVVPEG